MSLLHRAIHGGFRQLGITEDSDKRAIYVRATGQPRLSLMSSQEQEAVVTELRKLGFRPAGHRSDGRKRLTGKYAKKMQALWIAGYNLGVVRNPDDEAIKVFICGHANIDSAEWLRYADDATRCIEPLKAMLARDGGVIWKQQAGAKISDGQRIAYAQWKILKPGDPGFWAAVKDIVDFGTDGPTKEQWITVMNHFGKLIRGRKGVQ